MVPQNTHENSNQPTEPSQTEQKLREALAAQEAHFTGERFLFPPEDEAFWRANRNLLEAMRRHEEAEEANAKPPDENDRGQI